MPALNLDAALIHAIGRNEVLAKLKALITIWMIGLLVRQ